MPSHSEIMEDCFSSSVQGAGRKETADTRVQILKYSVESIIRDQATDCKGRENGLEGDIGIVKSHL